MKVIFHRSKDGMPFRIGMKFYDRYYFAVKMFGHWFSIYK